MAKLDQSDHSISISFALDLCSSLMLLLLLFIIIIIIVGH